MSSNPNVNTLLSDTLKSEGISVLNKSGAIHALKYPAPLFVRPGNPVGIVLHNTSGMIQLENLVATWDPSQPNGKPHASHLAIDQSGRVGQFVRIEFADRATEHTLRHISIEFQAIENGGITGAQVKSAGVIAGFLHSVYGVDLKIAGSRTERGIAHHSLFVNAGSGGHANCPGGAIISRKSEIIDIAREVASKLTLTDEPAGRWEIKMDRWTWIYTFDPSGNVTWRDPFNNQSGKGTWKNNGNLMVLSWFNSSTKETWNLPLKSVDQTGSCTMKGQNYALRAKRLTD